MCLNTYKFFPGSVVLVGACRRGEWMHVRWRLSQKDCISELSGVNVWHTLLTWPRWMAKAQMLKAVVWSIADMLLNCATP